MSNNLSVNETQTIWVVAKLSKEVLYDDAADEPVVEDQGYWQKEKADARAAHVMKHDGARAWVYPVRFWAPPAAVMPSPPPGVPWTPVVQYPQPWFPPAIHNALVNAKPGQKLLDYGPLSAWQPQPELSEVVSDAWGAWRLAQANAGNLDEAGRAGPDKSELEALYQEPASPPRHPALPEEPALVH